MGKLVSCCPESGVFVWHASFIGLLIISYSCKETPIGNRLAIGCKDHCHLSHSLLPVILQELRVTTVLPP